ncbi:hypothetical protein BBJ28_00001557 [Nothophytophthora sp. Chile5]|nr:hypothetical protein BBJ28_00001557 [Nothophytophthora sp. Chile5]
MLRSLSIQPVLPIMSGDASSHSRPEPVADVLAIADPSKGVNAVIEVYFRPATGPQQPLADRSPDYAFKVSFSELKKLRSRIQTSVGRGGHCDHCKRVAMYMTYCWERPRLLLPSWHGGMSLQTDALAAFLNQLLCFSSELGSESHPELVGIVARFLQPHQDV